MRPFWTQRGLIWRAVALSLVLAPSLARAVQYEAEIKFDDEVDLYELLVDGQITDSTFETLLDLYRSGVNLSTATRDELYVLPGLTYEDCDEIIEYRQLAGGIRDPLALVEAEILTEEQLLQIAPFLLRSNFGKRPVAGNARLLSAYTLTDKLAPPTLLQGRLRGYGVTVGAAMTLNRLRLDDITYSSTRQGLLAPVPEPSVGFPKAFAMWENPKVKAIFGTFRVGFGQRLTLDNTSRLSPDGFYADDTIWVPLKLSRACSFDDPALCPEGTHAYVTDDFYYKEGFRGAAVSLKGLEFGGVTLKATAFASYQTRQLYEYELYNRAHCSDPNDDSNSNCDAPPVFVQNGENSTATKYSYATLSNLFTETAGGANATLVFFGRGRIGITGYGATTQFNVPGVNLDFQEWSRYPWNGGFGAVGVDGAYGVGKMNFFIEAARSFDAIPKQGGDFGVIQRTVYGSKQHEIELSLRYYGPNFVNPYSRSISAPDELNGLRTRNEAGGRLRYQGRPNDRLRLRASLDVWAWPGDNGVKDTAGRKSLDAYVRADVRPLQRLQVSVWGRFRDKNLDVNEGEQCFQTSTETNEFGETVPCSGRLYRVAARAEYLISKRFEVAAQYQRDFLDDPKYKDSFRQDALAYLDLIVRPTDTVRLRWRTRFLDEDTADDASLETSVWSYVDAVWRINPGLSARLRYDLYRFLDSRESTALRTPQTENRFRLELVTQF